MRQAERRAIRNRAARSSVRTYVKNAVEAVAATASDAAEVVREAVSELDKAAQKGIVHRNAAARHKSRLMSRLYRLSVAPAQVEEPASKTKAPAKRATTSRAGAGDKRPAARKPSASGTARRGSTRARE
jgi:small subunit ribosomal protein S20